PTDRGFGSIAPQARSTESPPPPIPSQPPTSASDCSRTCCESAHSTAANAVATLKLCALREPAPSSQVPPKSSPTIPQSSVRTTLPLSSPPDMRRQFPGICSCSLPPVFERKISAGTVYFTRLLSTALLNLIRLTLRKP